MAKLNDMKLMVCCANGAGSSLMMKLTVQKVLDKLRLTPAALDHRTLVQGKAEAADYDVIICANTFASEFEEAQQNGTILITLRNIMSQPEIEKGLRAAGLLD